MNIGMSFNREDLRRLLKGACQERTPPQIQCRIFLHKRNARHLCERCRVSENLAHRAEVLGRDFEKVLVLHEKQRRRAPLLHEEVLLSRGSVYEYSALIRGSFLSLAKSRSSRPSNASSTDTNFLPVMREIKRRKWRLS